MNNDEAPAQCLVRRLKYLLDAPSKTKASGGPTRTSVMTADALVVSCRMQMKVSDLAGVCLIIDLEEFRLPTEWVIRCMQVDGQWIDPYLWGPKTTFVVHGMGWCPVYAPSEADAYQYDHPMQKYDLHDHGISPSRTPCATCTVCCCT